jgi:hypothetical protein
MSIDSSRALVTSYIRLILPMNSLKTLANGSFKQFEELNSPNGVDVMLEFKDIEKNLSTEIKVDSFRISLEDSTFEKLNKLIGEGNYTLF